VWGTAASSEYRAGGAATGGRYLHITRGHRAPFTTLHEINQLMMASAVDAGRVAHL
jgi:hypothetical protein